MVMMCVCTIMFVTQLGGEAGVSNPQTEKLKTFFRAMSILLIPITATFPSVSHTGTSNYLHRMARYVSFI